jgi:DNA helicase-2/ATP-dependent DNA helicase PcrA
MRPNTQFKGSTSLRDDLSPLQRQAVEHTEGPLLVVAGAGTGKTTVIARRIAYLIDVKKVHPDQILALTFTDKAAGEMQERVDLLVRYGLVTTWISTFHAFGNRILKDYAIEIGLTPDFRVLTRADQVVFLLDHLFELPLDYYRPLGNPTRHIEALVGAFSRAKDEDVTPEEYIAYVETVGAAAKASPGDRELQDVARQQREVADCYAAYQALKAKHGFIDFGDQVMLTLRLFREHPSVLARYQERFRYILVDEFQDTNVAQFELVKLLAGRHRNLAVVGDDDQSIYKFRGAAVSNILSFAATYPEATQIVISENYRSPQPVLDAAYRLICHNNPDRLEVKQGIDKRLVAKSTHLTPPRHLHYDALTTESDEVSGLIAEMVASGRRRYGDIAILVRSNNDADPFLRSLNMRQIPWRFSGSAGLYSQEEIRLLIAFLRTVSAPDDSVSLYYLASSEIYGLPVFELTQMANFASRRNRPLFWVLSHLDEISELEEIDEPTRARAKEFVRDVRSYVEASRTMETGQLLYDFLTRTGHLERLARQQIDQAEMKIQNIARFFTIVAASGPLLVHDRAPRFVERLDALIAAGDDPATAEPDLEADAVHVLTVHKAKGLEFPVVFMVSLINGRFPWPRRRHPIELPDPLIKEILPSGDYHLQEERRLFYVGMTRAKEELYLTSARDYGGARSRKVSQFVLEALDLPGADRITCQPSALETIHRHAPQVREPAAEFRPIPDDQVITLSHYHIDDYLTCPLKYKYVHILRVPVMRHHSVVYGAAIHEAIRAYHSRKRDGRPMTKEELLDLFRAHWVSEGFLSLEHEERRKREGEGALSRFYDDEEASGVIPWMVEEDFSFMLGRARVAGRWDRIDRVSDGAVIIDFKSSEIRLPEEARKRAKESVQLEIYALAYLRVYGVLPARVELRFLGSGLVGAATKTEADLARREELILEVAGQIRSRRYDPHPMYQACQYCAYREICPHTAR